MAENNLNLIPSEYAVNKGTLKAKKAISGTSTFLVVILFLSLVAFIVLYYFYYSQFKTISASVDSLKTKITNMQASEQKMVLAKDRLEKIDSIQNLDSALDEVEDFQEISSLVLSTGNSSINEVEIDATSLEASIINLDSTAFGNLFRSLRSLGRFEKILISELGYSIGNGYISGIIFE